MMPKGIAIFGATGGLGEAVARKVARRAPITIGYRGNEEKAERLAREIRAAGGEADVATVDLTDGSSVKYFIEASVARWDGLDGILSVTGPLVPLSPLVDVSEADFKRVYEVDVFGSFNILKFGALALKSSGGGAIVLTLTTAVLRTLDLDGLSGGPKTAVAALIRQMALEMGRYNVRCNGIAPGVIDAGIVHTLLDQLQGPAKQLFDTCLAQTPLARMGRADEIAAVMDFLVSPGATYVSGQIIGVDGGHSA